MNSEQNQLHLIKTIISLKKVAITVRFPCSISFALKHQSNIIDHKAVYDLVKGECLINRTIEMELEVQYLRGRYEDRKVSLLIYMVSSNGKIPAGSITINPTQKLLTDKKVSLEKCPDKNAFAVYTESFERIKILRSMTERGKLSNLASSTISGYNQLRRSNIQSSQNLLKQSEERMPENNEISSKNQLDDFKLIDSKELKQNLAASGSEKRLSNLPRLPKLRLEDLGRKSSFGSIEREYLDSKRSRNSNHAINDQNEFEIEAHKSKIQKLQQQRAGYIKQISKLRGSLVRVQSQDRIQLEDEINKVNDEKGNLQDQVQKLKEKSKFQERRQKQSNSLMKELRDELDRKKSRIFQLDSSRYQIEGQLSQKDKAINTLQSEKKKLQQSLQEQKTLQLSSQKRLQIKENSYKQQLKKLNEKITQSDSQRQKALFDYNNLLTQFEATQKKNQIMSRDKERMLNEEKTKLNKRIQHLIAENAKINEKVVENDSSLRDYEYLKTKYVEEEKDYQRKIKVLAESNEQNAKEIKNLQQQRKNLKTQILNSQQLFSNEKNNFKKKLSELNQQLFVQKEKHQKLQVLSINNQSKWKDLQSKLERQLKEKASALAKFQQLKKMQQKFLQDEQIKQKLTQTLSMQNINHNQKLSDYRNKLDSQKKKYEQMQAKYEEQVKYLINSKEYLQNQIEQMKWLQEKQTEKYETLNIKHRELGERLIEINQQVISFEEQVLTYQQEKQENENKITKYQAEIINYEQKMKGFQQNTQKGEIQYSKLQKKCSSFEKQIENLQQKLREIETNSKQRIENLDKTINEKNNYIKTKDYQIESLKQQFEKIKQQSSKQLNQISNNVNEILSLKQANKTLKNDYNTLISKYDSARQQEKQTKKKLNIVDQSLNQTNQQASNSSRLLQKIKIQFQEYKNVTSRCVQQIFTLITKEEAQSKNEVSILHSFPDEKLSLMQIQSLKKFQNIKKKNEEEIEAYKNETNYLEGQLAKLQSYIQKIQDESESTIKKMKDQLNKNKQENTKTTEEVQVKLQQQAIILQERKNEIEYFNSQIIRYESTITEQAEQINVGRLKEAALTKQIHNLQQDIFIFKEKEMKEKLLLSTESTQLEHILKIEREHNIEIVNGLKAEIKDKEKQIYQKNEEIKRWLMNDQEYKMHKAKNTDEVRELYQKIENERLAKQMLEAQLRDREKLLKDIQDQLTLSKQRQQQQKNAIVLKQQELNKLKADYHTLDQKVLSLKEQQNQKNLTTQQFQRKQRQKREKLQMLKNRLEQQNKEARQKCVRFESQNEFYKFFKDESTKKIQEFEKIKSQNFIQIIKCKQSMIRSEKQIGNYENKYYKLQIQIQNLSKEKELLIESNNKLQQRLTEFQEKCSELYRTLTELQSRDKEITRLQEVNQAIQEQNDKTLNELKANSIKLKQEIGTKSDKIRQLQQKLENSVIELNTEKDKWQVQLDNEKNIFQLKLQTVDENISALQNELEFQKEQAVKEIQGANGIIQELNEIIRQKQELIQYKQEVINQQNVRLQELNLQLSECVSKWQKEKQTYLPTSSKITQIKDEITRMNTFIIDLDGRNKQLLEINKRKVQQSIENKPSITEILKDLLILLQKHKNRMLNRCQSQKEKEAVISDFKPIQQKLDLTLKSTQIVTVKQ